MKRETKNLMLIKVPPAKAVTCLHFHCFLLFNNSCDIITKLFGSGNWSAIVCKARIGLSSH